MNKEIKILDEVDDEETPFDSPIKTNKPLQETEKVEEINKNKENLEDLTIELDIDLEENLEEVEYKLEGKEPIEKIEETSSPMIEDDSIELIIDTDSSKDDLMSKLQSSRGSRKKKNEDTEELEKRLGFDIEEILEEGDIEENTSKESLEIEDVDDYDIEEDLIVPGGFKNNEIPEDFEVDFSQSKEDSLVSTKNVRSKSDFDDYSEYEEVLPKKSQKEEVKKKEKSVSEKIVNTYEDEDEDEDDVINLIIPKNKKKNKEEDINEPKEKKKTLKGRLIFLLVLVLLLSGLKIISVISNLKDSPKKEVPITDTLTDGTETNQELGQDPTNEVVVDDNDSAEVKEDNSDGNYLTDKIRIAIELKQRYKNDEISHLTAYTSIKKMVDKSDIAKERDILNEIMNSL